MLHNDYLLTSMSFDFLGYKQYEAHTLLGWRVKV